MIEQLHQKASKLTELNTHQPMVQLRDLTFYNTTANKTTNFNFSFKPPR